MPRYPYNYTVIDSPSKLPPGKNYCIIEEASYSSDGGYPGHSSNYSYCNIRLYKDEKEWREATEEMFKENVEQKYGTKREFSPVVINKAKMETKVNISIDLAA